MTVFKFRLKLMLRAAGCRGGSLDPSAASFFTGAPRHRMCPSQELSKVEMQFIVSRGILFGTQSYCHTDPWALAKNKTSGLSMSKPATDLATSRPALGDSPTQAYGNMSAQSQPRAQTTEQGHISSGESSQVELLCSGASTASLRRGGW